MQMRSNNAISKRKHSILLAKWRKGRALCTVTRSLHQIRASEVPLTQPHWISRRILKKDLDMHTSSALLRVSLPRMS